MIPIAEVIENTVIIQDVTFLSVEKLLLISSKDIAIMPISIVKRLVATQIKKSDSKLLFFFTLFIRLNFQNRLL